MRKLLAVASHASLGGAGPIDRQVWQLSTRSAQSLLGDQRRTTTSAKTLWRPRVAIFFRRSHFPVDFRLFLFCLVRASSENATTGTLSSCSDLRTDCKHPHSKAPKQFRVELKGRPGVRHEEMGSRSKFGQVGCKREVVACAVDPPLQLCIGADAVFRASTMLSAQQKAKAARTHRRFPPRHGKRPAATRAAKWARARARQPDAVGPTTQEKVAGMSQNGLAPRPAARSQSARLP